MIAKEPPAYPPPTVSSWMTIGVLYAIIGVVRFWFRSEDVWTACNGELTRFHEVSTQVRRTQITVVCLVGPLDILWSMLEVYFVELAIKSWTEEQSANHLPITQPAPPKGTATSARARSPPPPYTGGGGNTVVV